MNALIFLFLPLIIQLLILYAISQLTDKMVMRLLGRSWYLAFMWPGVIIHELSHFVGCLITFTKVFEVKLFAPSGETLGYVSHAKTKNPIKNVVISIAPLFGISLVMWVITLFLFPDLYRDMIYPLQQTLQNSAASANSFNSITEALRTYSDTFFSLLSYLSFSDWQTYVYVFLMVTLASHAAPSRVDLKHTMIGVVGFGILFSLLWYVSSVTHIDVIHKITEWLSFPLLLLTTFIAYSILFALLAFMLLGAISLLRKLFPRG